STITFGHYNYDSSWDSYNGQEFDWIMMDEATQFTYEQFRMLGGCLRGVNTIPKRFYLTCNPGGVGHRWVKRLFVDRDFVKDSKDPEDDENPKDYKFIFARVEDNIAMKETDPVGYAQYLKTLKMMPEKVRDAYRYGLWDDLGGAYFSEFQSSKHVIEPFAIPDGWRRYRAFDYGLDMFACLWIAVDFSGRCYVYREFSQKNLIVPDAAREIHNNTAFNEHIDITFAPPDMWMTQKTDGKTMAEGFMLENVAIVKVSNNRVQGHMQIKTMLSDMPDGKPMLMFFRNCKRLLEDLPAIQSDDNNPNDCAKQPHDVTHFVDALRYFCVSRTMPAFESREKNIFEEDAEVEEYENYMCGGEPNESYIGR
ncbi:MAG: phage terminase large subunit, partial [Oscillospiraceae bacterium]